MRIISIVTPVVAGKHDHLLATYHSLVRQQMPADWTWQWIVQEDGQTGLIQATLPADARISAGAARTSRAASARTLALSRVEGELVRAVDADDLLTPGALARDITTLMDHADVGWCVSAALDLLTDGELRPGPRDPQPGRLPSGQLAVGQRMGRLPVVGTTLCGYTALVRALGGWQALPADEDVALMLAAEAVTDGWMIGEPSLLYRRWPNSSTADIAFYDHAEMTARHTTLMDRVDALRHIGWRWSPDRADREVPQLGHRSA